MIMYKKTIRYYETILLLRFVTIHTEFLYIKNIIFMDVTIFPEVIVLHLGF